MSSFNGPTEHLSWNELKCKDGTPYPHEWRNNRAIELGELFEFVRLLCGRQPINILSAYRTPTHNLKVGGAKNSQHLYGRALDLRPPEGMHIDTFYQIIKSMRLSSSLKGLGKYSTFIHIDTRPTIYRAYWFGK